MIAGMPVFMMEDRGPGRIALQSMYVHLPTER